MEREEAIVSVKKWFDSLDMIDVALENPNCEFQYIVKFPNKHDSKAQALSVAMPLQYDIIDVVKDIVIELPEPEQFIHEMEHGLANDFLWGLRLLLIQNCDFNMTVPTITESEFKLRLFRRIYSDNISQTGLMREIELLNRMSKTVQWYFMRVYANVEERQGIEVVKNTSPEIERKPDGVMKRRRDERLYSNKGVFK